MEITFLGAAGTVTGSKFLVRAGKTTILVDCGLYQGLKEFRVMNWDILPVDIHNLDAVILTHGHLDHCGYLPRLVKNGYSGPIYGTEASIDVAKIVLLDAAKIQEEDASYANKHGFSKHHPAAPLYDSNDVERTLPLFRSHTLHQKLSIKDLDIQFSAAGHILGAASVSISDGKRSILFSGDIGRTYDPLMPPPEAPQSCDYIVMESTYGDRIHSGRPSREVLADLVTKIHERKSVLLIPAFAIGRSQNLLCELLELRKEGRIPASIPIYLNTPMGQRVTHLYKTYSSQLKVPQKAMTEILHQVHFVNSAEESKALNEKKGPMIIIAASGMLTGGRILYHLKSFGGNSKNILLLAGFQGPGTRGWALANGCTEVKIHGQYVQINAEVINSDSFSAHADQRELLQWLKRAPVKPKQVFLVHGEPSASAELGNRIKNQLGFPVTIPKLNQKVVLDGVKSATHDEPENYDPQI